MDQDSSDSEAAEQKMQDTVRRESVVPRENLVNTAVTFLSDQKIQNQDAALLRRFLLKKGLTEEEASIAFQRSEASKKKTLPEYGQPSQQLQHYMPPPYPPPPPLPPVPSTWHTVHNIITTVTSIGGILYAIYWLWKTYVSPYLFGRKPKKKPVETSLAELEAAVSGCVTDVKTIRSSLDTLTDQRAAELTHSVIVTRIQEVKSEISSLKTLLLNRNQFPAAPPPMGTGPLSIPAWQLSAGETSREHDGEGEGEGEAETEKDTGSNTTTNGSDSSMEIVKDVGN